MSIYFKERTAASVPTPDAGKVALFVEIADGKTYLKDELGVVTLLGVPASRLLTAGAGMTGGGTLAADRTFDVVANVDGSIIVNANDIQVGILASDAQHGTRGGGSVHANAVASGAAGFLTGSDKAKLDGLSPGAAVASVSGTAPIVSSGGTTPAISITAATGVAAGSLSAADKTKLDTVTSGAAVASVGGTAPIVSSGGTTPAISITAATGVAAGSLSAADKTKLDTVTSGAAVASVGGTAPIVSSGGTTPAISITAASGAAAGSMSAADKTKLDTMTSGAAVASVSGTAPIASSGGTTPAISITAATTAAAGSMSAQDKKRMSESYDAVADFGFVGDYKSGFELPGAGTQIVMTNGSAIINLPTSAPFTDTATDGGKRIVVTGAGASNAMYVGTILTVNSTSQAVLSTNALTTVTANAVGPILVSWGFGTDNTTAIGNMTTLVNTTNAAFPGVKIVFPQSATNAYGFPISAVFNKMCQIQGIGGGYTCDVGDYTRTGGTRLAWCGTSSDGGSAFGGMIAFVPTGIQSLKRVAMRHIWLDCSNVAQNQALFGLKLSSCHGFILEDFYIHDALALGIWTDVGTTPTEAKDTTRFSIRDFCSRQLDNCTITALVPMTTPSTVAAGSNNVVLTASGQAIAVAANTLPTSGYCWMMTSVGAPVLVRFTGGGGTASLTGCTIATENVVHTPTLITGANIVQATPSTACSIYFNGGSAANSCCSVVDMLQISYGTTWGPAAIEYMNSDSIEVFQVMMNGGNNTNDGAINRQRRPGVRLNGSIVSATLAARNNMFRSGDPGGPSGGGVSVMGVNNAGTRLLATSGPHYWDLLQLGNGAPIPTVESGAMFDWTPNGAMRLGSTGVPAAVANQSIANTLTLIAGSMVSIPPQGFQVGTVISWKMAGTQTAAAVGACIFTVRLGTNGTTADAAILTVTLPTSTVAAAGTGFSLEIILTIRTLGGAATVIGKGILLQGLANGIGGALSVSLVNPTTATFNSATANQFMHADFISGGAGTTLVFEQVAVNVLNSANP